MKQCFKSNFKWEVIFVSSEDIKRRMVENTKRLLQENATITIKDIATASYVNIAAVNYHFGSKEKLIGIVLEEIIAQLKEYVTDQIIALVDVPLGEKLEIVINYFYNFSIENIGILNYLFLSNELQKESSTSLMNQFFADNDFTRLIYQSLSENTVIKNEKEVRARYIMLFSSFCIPLFFQISQSKLDIPMKIEMFQDPEFRQYYIKSIMKLM